MGDRSAIGSKRSNQEEIKRTKEKTFPPVNPSQEQMTSPPWQIQIQHCKVPISSFSSISFVSMLTKAKGYRTEDSKKKTALQAEAHVLMVATFSGWQPKTTAMERSL